MRVQVSTPIKRIQPCALFLKCPNIVPQPWQLCAVIQFLCSCLEGCEERTISVWQKLVLYIILSLITYWCTSTVPSCFPHVLPRTQRALYVFPLVPETYFWVFLYFKELTMRVWQTILTSWLNTFHHFKSVNKSHKVIQSSQTFLPELLSFLQTGWAMRH